MNNIYLSYIFIYYIYLYIIYTHIYILYIFLYIYIYKYIFIYSEADENKIVYLKIAKKHETQSRMLSLFYFLIYIIALSIEYF